MMSYETTVRLKRFEADEKARKVEDLEYMIHDFEQMVSDLSHQIMAEEERSGIKDPSHFSYSTFAKSAAQRKANLLASIEELREKLEAAQAEHQEAKESLEKATAAGEGRENNRTSRFATAESEVSPTPSR